MAPINPNHSIRTWKLFQTKTASPSISSLGRLNSHIAPRTCARGIGLRGSVYRCISRPVASNLRSQGGKRDARWSKRIPKNPRAVPSFFGAPQIQYDHNSDRFPQDTSFGLYSPHHVQVDRPEVKLVFSCVALPGCVIPMVISINNEKQEQKSHWGTRTITTTLLTAATPRASNSISFSSFNSKSSKHLRVAPPEQLGVGCHNAQRAERHKTRGPWSWS